MSTMPAGYDELLDTFRKTQTSLQNLIANHAQLESQLNENGMVKEELERLKEDDPVFKLCGKVLVRQDRADAQSTIERRIEFIQTELTKARKTIEDMQAKAAALRTKLIEAQQSGALQQQQQQQQSGGVTAS